MSRRRYYTVRWRGPRGGMHEASAWDHAPELKPSDTEVTVWVTEYDEVTMLREVCGRRQLNRSWVAQWRGRVARRRAREDRYRFLGES